MTSVSMITIGQTPRDDPMPRFQELLGPGFRLFEAGALDGLSAALLFLTYIKKEMASNCILCIFSAID